MRVKSQCILLRSNVDEFEKRKKMIGTTNEQFPNENILQILNTIRTTKDLVINDYEDQLKFYQTIVNELELHQCSITSNEMQQD
jgi:hypothetical protein